MPDRELVNIDGWLTDDPVEFRAYSSGRVNRWTFRDQISVDLRSWKPWAGWVVATLAIWQPLNPGRQSIALVAIGVAVWIAYLRMLSLVVGGMRRVRLLEAIVRFDTPHPLFSGMVTGGFVEIGAGTVGQAALPRWAAERTRRLDGSHQVLVAYDSKAQLSAVVGIRPP